MSASTLASLHAARARLFRAFFLAEAIVADAAANGDPLAAVVLDELRAAWDGVTVENMAAREALSRT